MKVLSQFPHVNFGPMPSEEDIFYAQVWGDEEIQGIWKRLSVMEILQARLKREDSSVIFIPRQ